MRLLTHVNDQQSAYAITSLLDAGGIPTFVQDYRPRLSPSIAIFVCIDTQLDDAQALLRNPDHEVRDPVDVNAFKSDVRRLDPRLVGWGLAALLCVAVVVFLMAYLSVKR